MNLFKWPRLTLNIAQGPELNLGSLDMLRTLLQNTLTGRRQL